MSLSYSAVRRFGNAGIKRGERIPASDMRRLDAAREQQKNPIDRDDRV
jgi:hypothetical protein